MQNDQQHFERIARAAVDIRRAKVGRGQGAFLLTSDPRAWYFAAAERMRVGTLAVPVTDLAYPVPICVPVHSSADAESVMRWYRITLQVKPVVGKVGDVSYVRGVHNTTDWGKCPNCGNELRLVAGGMMAFIMVCDTCNMSAMVQLKDISPSGYSGNIDVLVTGVNGAAHGYGLHRNLTMDTTWFPTGGLRRRIANHGSTLGTLRVLSVNDLADIICVAMSTDMAAQPKTHLSNHPSHSVFKMLSHRIRADFDEYNNDDDGYPLSLDKNERDEALWARLLKDADSSTPGAFGQPLKAEVIAGLFLPGPALVWYVNDIVACGALVTAEQAHHLTTAISGNWAVRVITSKTMLNDALRDVREMLAGSFDTMPPIAYVGNLNGPGQGVRVWKFDERSKNWELPPLPQRSNHAHGIALDQLARDQYRKRNRARVF